MIRICLWSVSDLKCLEFFFLVLDLEFVWIWNVWIWRESGTREGRSPEGAEGDSPGRKPCVGTNKNSESRRDGTHISARTEARYSPEEISSNFPAESSR